MMSGRLQVLRMFLAYNILTYNEWVYQVIWLHCKLRSICIFKKRILGNSNVIGEIKLRTWEKEDFKKWFNPEQPIAKENLKKKKS